MSSSFREKRPCFDVEDSVFWMDFCSATENLENLTCCARAKVATSDLKCRRVLAIS